MNGHPALGHVLSPQALQTPGEAGRQGRGRLGGLKTRADGHVFNVKVCGLAG